MDRHDPSASAKNPNASGSAAGGGAPSAAASARGPTAINPVQAAFDDPADSGRNMLSGGYSSKKRVNERYKIIGFISSGTYGRVYKAQSRNGGTAMFAIKKFKPEKEGEVQYTGISQSAMREMALCTELSHPNLVHTVEIILEDKCIFIVFEYAEHDLLQIIHHHTQPQRHPIPARSIKSILYQVLKGLVYLHKNWVMHRDLKPANIMVTSSGQVKIGDLGLARIFCRPLHSLFNGDKVVVTIWYRAPELLLGSRHYTPAVDLWAVGCIFAELLSLRPIFKGEEAKLDSKKTVPFQRNQMQKIVEVLGMPTKEKWPLLTAMPEYPNLSSLSASHPRIHRPLGLENWYDQCLKTNQYPLDSKGNPTSPGEAGFSLLQGLLEYDPQKRLTAEQALEHPYFTAHDDRPELKPSDNCFEGNKTEYPHRRITVDFGFPEYAPKQTMSRYPSRLELPLADCHNIDASQSDVIAQALTAMHPYDASFGQPTLLASTLDPQATVFVPQPASATFSWSNQPGFGGALYEAGQPALNPPAVARVLTSSRPFAQLERSYQPTLQHFPPFNPVSEPFYNDQPPLQCFPPFNPASEPVLDHQSPMDISPVIDPALEFMYDHQMQW